MDAFDVDEREGLRIAILIDMAQRRALQPFGPELTLSAAEVLWAYGDEEAVPAKET